jgi:hypothetical protein
VRQLNLHEFFKATRDPSSHRYRHANFQNGNPTALALITRQAEAGWAREGRGVVMQKRRALQSDGALDPDEFPSAFSDSFPPSTSSSVSPEHLESKLKELLQQSASTSARLSAVEERCATSKETVSTVWSDSENLWGVLAQGAPHAVAAVRRRPPPYLAVMMAAGSGSGDGGGAGGPSELTNTSEGGSHRQKKIRKKKQQHLDTGTIP